MDGGAGRGASGSRAPGAEEGHPIKGTVGEFLLRSYLQ